MKALVLGIASLLTALFLSTDSAEAQAFGVSKTTDLDQLRPNEIGPNRRTIIVPPVPHELLVLYVADVGYTRNICAVTGISRPLNNIQANRLQIDFAALLRELYGDSTLVPRANRMHPNATHEMVWSSPAHELDTINLAVALVEPAGEYHVYLRYTFADPVACMAQPAPSARGL